MVLRMRAGMRRTAQAVAVGVALVAVLVGCSSGGDEDEVGRDEPEDATDPLAGDDREAYVAAFEETGRDPITAETTSEASCVAEAIVAAVGVDQLRDVATPREIAAAAGGASLAGLGLDVDAETTDAIYLAITECADPAQLFLDAIPGALPTGPASECFTEHLDEALVREVVMTRLIDGDQALADNPDIPARLTAIGRACTLETGP